MSIGSITCALFVILIHTTVIAMSQDVFLGSRKIECDAEDGHEFPWDQLSSDLRLPAPTKAITDCILCTCWKEVIVCDWRTISCRDKPPTLANQGDITNSPMSSPTTTPMPAPTTKTTTTTDSDASPKHQPTTAAPFRKRTRKPFTPRTTTPLPDVSLIYPDDWSLKNLLDPMYDDLSQIKGLEEYSKMPFIPKQDLEIHEISTTNAISKSPAKEPRPETLSNMGASNQKHDLETSSIEPTIESVNILGQGEYNAVQNNGSKDGTIDTVNPWVPRALESIDAASFNYYANQVVTCIKVLTFFLVCTSLAYIISKFRDCLFSRNAQEEDHKQRRKSIMSSHPSFYFNDI